MKRVLGILLALTLVVGLTAVPSFSAPNPQEPKKEEGKKKGGKKKDEGTNPKKEDGI